MKDYHSQKILKKRLRDENNVPYGIVVALNKNQLGYSVCHSKLDEYNDKLAFRIALSRAKSNKETTAEFWINHRKRHLQKNHILADDCRTYFDEDMLDSMIQYFIEHKEDLTTVNEFREVKALAELYLMQKRANKYFKEEK